MLIVLPFSSTLNSAVSVVNGANTSASTEGLTGPEYSLFGTRVAPFVRRVVKAQVERPVHDLPKRVRGVGAGVARLGPAGQERVDRRASLRGRRCQRERACGRHRGRDRLVRGARAASRARSAAGRGDVPGDRQRRDLAQLVVGEPVLAVGRVQGEHDRVGRVVRDDVSGRPRGTGQARAHMPAHEGASALTMFIQNTTSLASTVSPLLHL